MARPILPSNFARRAVRQSGIGATTRTRAGPITPHREEATTASQFVAAPAGLPEGFETAAKAAGEDGRRARRMRRVLNRPGPTNWLNIAARLWLAKQLSPRVGHPTLDTVALDSLAERLERGVAQSVPPPTLASSLRMRAIREGLNGALLDAFAEYPDAELRTVTVIYAGWGLTPAELDGTNAAKLKAQFRQHLNRAGVFKVPGPLFAVLHGEFEPSSGRYQLHFHLVTTAAKAAALQEGLRAKTIKGYTVTPTGAAPVRRSRIGDRVAQLSYLAKSYWPSRPVIQIGGKLKRVRGPRRIPEPYATQVLLWLDRQKFTDLVVIHDCWSRRKGGSAAMKRLYLFVKGVS